MKQTILIFILCCAADVLSAQYVYTIEADSVKITARDSAELIIENHTQHIPGFLYNRVKGRTEFRRALSKINDSLYLVGEDSLKLKYPPGPDIVANNGVLKTGNTIQFGNDLSNPYGGAYQIRPVVYNQNNHVFNWMTQGNAILTFSKAQFSTSPTESNVLRANYITRFAAAAQGGILLEGNHTSLSSSPLSWISFRNNHANARTFTFLGDTLAALMQVGLLQGIDGKTYHNIKFHLGSDSAHANNQVLSLYPSFATNAGVIKIPTAAAKRLVVDPQVVGGGADNYKPLTYDNPYSTLVVDAMDQPVVFGSLPQTDVSGHFLVIDNNGRVWKGPATSGFSALGGNSRLASASMVEPEGKVMADQTSSSSSLSDAKELKFEVAAGLYYKFKFILVFQGTNISSGIRLGIKTPSAEVFSANATIPQKSDGRDSQYFGALTSGSEIVTQGIPAANTDHIAIIEGIILPSSAGQVQLSFGSAVTGSAISLRTGSMVESSQY